jgi:CPA2 family monovalent cation:H+ antiporter-2
MLLAAHIPPVIYDVSIIFGLAIVVLLICNHFKIPTVLGFLITGVVAGPDAFNLVKEANDLSVFAEIGIIFLLFSIGIEFSLKDLIRIRKQVFIGGAIQLFATTVVITILCYYFDIKLKESIFLGLLFSLSSTAIVLKVLQDMGRIQTAQGKSTMAILIFQDIAIVPLMLLTPYLTKSSTGFDFNFFLVILKGIVTVFLVLFIARVLMPKLLFAVAKSRSSELFLLTVLVVCLSVAWLTAQLGLSLSLGAFLAGLVISESEYSHEVFGTILPFREVFTSFFFISIGLLVDLDVLLEFFPTIAAVAIGIIILKTILAGAAIFFTGSNLRIAFLSGLFVSQVGEFSFILAENGKSIGVIGNTNFQLFLSVSLLTMAATPYIIQNSDKLSSLINKIFMNETLKKRFPLLIKSSIELNQSPARLKDHIVLIGYGDAGKNISKVIAMAKIPFVIIDSDPEIILATRTKKRFNSIFGSATTQSVLNHANIKEARVVVIAISSPSEIRNIILAIKKLDSAAFIITTTRRMNDLLKIFDAGASDVISEQFETSIEVITRVLVKYMVSRNEIDDFIVKLRGLNYDMMRTIRYEHQGLQDYRLEISDTEILTMRIKKESTLNGKQLSELNLRANWGISILAIKRSGNIFANPEPTIKLAENDVLVIFGTHQLVDNFSRI